MAEDEPLTAVLPVPAPAASGPAHGESLLRKSLRKFRRDRFGMAGLFVVCLFGLTALGVKVGLFCTLKDATTPVGPQFIRPGQVYDR
ncbi:MAG: hypothetical protein KGL53_13525, partial [Elusimicrobia bacterium]|nr:hypothetical protein [Elusimicrobiota bacterium]